jgi:hypothetical protein
MACPTVLSTPYTPPGWGPSSQGPGNIAQIVPPTNVIPPGASVAFIQLSVASSVAKDAAYPSNSDGQQAGNPVRVQVADPSAGFYNDSLAFAPLYNGAIYIHNSASGHNMNVWVVFLGYA